MEKDNRLRIVYVTSSDFKKSENLIFQKQCEVRPGVKVAEKFEFAFQGVEIKEDLEADLSAMVTAEARRAYEQIRVPCIVEHAGLIFKEYEERSYPGGLTKPMWNTLGNEFVKETNSAGREALARAVVAYCDGSSIKTFAGETRGTIAESPRGGRNFYWDTVFIPDKDEGNPETLTYAEIADHPAYGIAYKVKELSQSSRAMIKLLNCLLDEGAAPLWNHGQ